MAQFLYKQGIKGDSMIKLKEGRILFYYFSKYYNIYIYDQKTFQNLLEIDLYKFIYEYKKKEGKNKYNFMETNGYYSDEIYLFLGEYRNKNKNSIKEIYNGLILIGRDNYLIELKLDAKSYEYKVVKELDNIVSNISELSDKRIIAFTNIKIIILNKENEEYIFKEEYVIEENWKITPFSTIYEDYGEFNQYYSCDEISKKRLILNSFSSELKYRNSPCLDKPPREICSSKIIFIDLVNFKEIKLTETFEVNSNYIILKNYIIIQFYKNVFLYDINTLDIIQNIEFPESYGKFYKYNKNILVPNSKDEKYMILNLFKIEDSKFIKHCEIEINNYEILYNRYYERKMKFYRLLYALQDKIIIIFNKDIYVFKSF